MRSSLQRACLVALIGLFGVVGSVVTAGSAAATPGPGSQVAATEWTPTTPPAVGTDSYDENVSCVSSVFCIAAMVAPSPYVQQWNGSAWNTIALPALPGATAVGLTAVSCTSTSFCMVAGVYANNSQDSPVAYQWNGADWSVSATPTLPSQYASARLSGLSCTGPTWCMLTGAAVNGSTSNVDTLAEQWNGTSWSITSTPSIANHTDDEFTALSCTGPANCMAVGYNVGTGAGFAVPSAGLPVSGPPQLGPLGLPGSPLGTPARARAQAQPHAAGTYLVLAEQWNGASWSVTTTPDPSGTTEPVFYGVSCAGTGFCMATGFDESTQDVAFAEEWSGGTWSQTPLPASPTANGDALLATSCVSATSCTSVGAAFTDANSQDFEVMTAWWNGSAWTLGTVSTPSSPEALWFGVSCLAGGSCVATGVVSAGVTDAPYSGEASISRTGYRMVASDGGVFAFGPSEPSPGAPFLGSTGGMGLDAPIVGMAVMPAGDGYYLVGADGGVFNYGSAQFYGSMGGMPLNKPIVGMAVTGDGGGYWLVASDGGVFSFGDAQFYGSTGGLALAKPIVGMASTPNGLGYYLVAGDGGVFAYGNAVFAGSEGGMPLNKPIVGMAVTAAGGYYLVGADGGVFNFGAPFLGSAGSLTLNKPIVGIGVAAGGYYLVGSDGGIFSYPGAGTPPFFGSEGGATLNKPIVGIGT